MRKEPKKKKNKKTEYWIFTLTISSNNNNGIPQVEFGEDRLCDLTTTLWGLRGCFRKAPLTQAQQIQAEK